MTMVLLMIKARVVSNRHPVILFLLFSPLLAASLENERFTAVDKDNKEDAMDIPEEETEDEARRETFKTPSTSSRDLS